MESTMIHGLYELKTNGDVTISIFRDKEYIGLLGRSCIQLHGKKESIVLELVHKE